MANNKIQLNGIKVGDSPTILCVLICLMMFVALSIYPSIETKAQYSFETENEEFTLTYDELLISVYVNANWTFSTSVFITNTDVVYVHVEDLFNNLEIPCNMGSTNNSLVGFIGNDKKAYTIDFNSKQIKIGDKTIQTIQGLKLESGAMFLETSLLAEAFGLILTFNPRSLSAKLKSEFELPKIKQKNLEKTRNNILKLKGGKIAVDTVIKRDYHLFRFGMLDWGLASYQTLNEPINNYVSLGVGAELLFGEANVLLNYYDKYDFDVRQLRYSWRWIDNDKKLIKQAQLGNISQQSISSINFPVIGATVRNSPTTVRKASGYYDINEQTEPNWTVELYINDVLIDYTVSDASGLFVFKVPITYGYTSLKLKFYGPLGEERTEERTMNVPFTFMPANTFEYGVSSGYLQDDNKSRFGRGDFNYGINNHLTIGGGVEYLSSIANSPYIPFAKIAFQPFSKLVLNFEYAHDVRMQSSLYYNFTRSAFLEIDYAKYVEGQLATQFNALEESKVRISFPFKSKQVSGFTKVNFNQYIYQSFKYNQVDLMFSAYWKQFSANSSTLYNWISNNPSYSTTDLSVSYRMKKGMVFRPSAQYNLKENNFIRLRAEVEKRVSKAYLSISYERNMLTKDNNVYFSFRYDLPFARTSSTASSANKKVRFSESAQGSLAFGGDNNSVKAGSNSSLGKGGILFYPFLDLNQNGIFDKGEQMVLLSNVRVSGGKVIISEKDSIVRVSNLNAFVDYNVEFSNSDLDDIAWRFKHKTYQVLVDPNQYKKVYVPVLSLGEISGMIYLNQDDNLKGIGRITVEFYNKKGVKVAETLSELDGYFSYLGLNPGDYIIRIDEKQMKMLGYHSMPLLHNTVVHELEYGEIIEGIDFVLKPKEEIANVPATENRLLNSNEKANSEEHLQTIEIAYRTESNINKSFINIADIDEMFYTVQIGVYRNYVTASQLKNLTPIFYEVLPNGTIRYYSGKYNSLGEARIAKGNCIEKGMKDAYVVTVHKRKK